MRAYLTDLLLLCLGVLVAIAIAAFWPIPIHAEEAPPPCTGLAEVAEAITAQGGALLDLVDLPGDGFDQVAFFDISETIVLGFVVNGCMVGSPVPIGDVRKVTPA